MAVGFRSVGPFCQLGRLRLQEEQRLGPYVYSFPTSHSQVLLPWVRMGRTMLLLDCHRFGPDSCTRLPFDCRGHRSAASCHSAAYFVDREDMPRAHVVRMTWLAAW